MLPGNDSGDSETKLLEYDSRIEPWRICSNFNSWRYGYKNGTSLSQKARAVDANATKDGFGGMAAVLGLEPDVLEELLKIPMPLRLQIIIARVSR